MTEEMLKADRISIDFIRNDRLTDPYTEFPIERYIMVEEMESWQLTETGGKKMEVTVTYNEASGLLPIRFVEESL